MVSPLTSAPHPDPCSSWYSQLCLQVCVYRCVSTGVLCEHRRQTCAGNSAGPSEVSTILSFSTLALSTSLL